MTCLYPRDHCLQVLAAGQEQGLVHDRSGALDPRGHFAREALGLPDYPPRGREQSLVGLLQSLLPLLGAAAGRAANFHQPIAHRSGAIAKLRSCGAGELRNAFHRAREHPHPIAEQAAVGRVVNVSLHDGGVHPQPATLDDSPLLGDGHDALMNLGDDLRSQCDPELAQGLGVRNLFRTHPRELAIHQVRPHLALEDGVAPVAHVLE